MSFVLFESLEPRRMFADISALVLVDADTGQDLMPLTSGAIVDLSALPSLHLNVRAVTDDATRSVRFNWDGKKVRIDNSDPFAMRKKSWTPKSGTHTISAKAYSKKDGRGSASQSLKFSVMVDSGLPTNSPVPGNGDPPPVSSSWHLAFADEFDAKPDPNVWTSSLWGLKKIPGDSQIYDRSALSVDNGILSMTARQESLNGRDYVSGVISTGGVADQVAPGFAFKYGYVEARMKLPSGKGLWPAFWMLPTVDSNGQFRDDEGEIDIVELIGDRSHVAEVHVHRNNAEDGDGLDVGVDLSQDFHTYGVDWEADHIAWYLDGHEIFRTSDPALIPKAKHYLILDLAIGGAGSWPGLPNASTHFPASMQVDYVHVWQT